MSNKMISLGIQPTGGVRLTALDPSRAALLLKKSLSFPPAIHEVTVAP